MLTEIGAPSLLSMSVKTRGVAFLNRSKLYQGEGKKSEELRNGGGREESQTSKDFARD